MDDDDKQPSYERLDETNPERNHRSFFDWLRGKEETDEERLRKKLDEELKEAARQRAEQFEEERRVEEKREVAETKKLKKRWRAKLVEKSRKMLEQTTAQGDEATNGFDIAKLMVAERIVTLHEMLSDESYDLRRSEIKSLKIHIDFMGLLSEKLDRPELEVPEEIEQLYQTIATSVEETTGETPPENPDNQPETLPVSEADAAYTTFASSIITAIRRVIQQEAVASHESSDIHTSGGGSEPVPRPARTIEPTSIERPGRMETKESRPLTDQLLAIVKGAALSGEAIRKELSHTEHARRLADVVERAAMIDRRVERPQAVPHGVPAGKEPGELHIEKPSSPSPNKKIKYMTELELVTLAKAVEIGSGRLLSDAYGKGELDREGLVKVLEKYHKGQDYRSEFTFRRTKRQQQRRAAMSPEHLLQPPAPIAPVPLPTNSPIPSIRERARRQAKALGRTITSIVMPSTSNPQSRPRLKSSRTSQKITDHSGSRTQKATQVARDIRERLGREGQIALLFVSLLLMVILIVFVLEMNSL